MKPELSILIPSIRIQNLEKIIWQFSQWCPMLHEIIIIGPYVPPEEVLCQKHVKYIRDFGSPVRCMQIGLVMAEGNWLTWTADDTFVQESYHNAVKLLDFGNSDFYCFGYTESDNRVKQPLDYYRVNNAAPRSQKLPDSYMIFNVVFGERYKFEMLGGFDCENYECTFLAQTDLAIRAQYRGMKVEFHEYEILHSDHLPGRTGDHFAVNDGQLFHDEPYYRKKFCEGSGPIDFQNPQLDNWKAAPAIWERRFGASL